MNPKNFPIVEPDPDETIKDPKTGKTISRKRAFVLAGGAMAAGSALNEILETPVIGDPADETATAEIPAQQAWNPNTAPMASPDKINDDMSFSEAFSNAREELGAGGVFEWHGQYYNTFYAEELDDNNQPVVEYEVTDHHDLNPSEYSDPGSPGEDSFEQENQEIDSDVSPDIMAADFDMDGSVDAVYVDLNQDGSADGVYTDLNQDGQLTEDEVVFIHDPENLESPEAPSDGSLMSVDTNADGVDDILLADVEGDQVADAVGIDQNSDMQIDESEIIILNPEAMEGTELEPAEVEYSGEIAADMPEDVSDEVLDGMTDDIANIEDNFDEINNWS
jgi:hypothetical protein